MGIQFLEPCTLTALGGAPQRAVDVAEGTNAITIDGKLHGFHIPTGCYRRQRPPQGSGLYDTLERPVDAPGTYVYVTAAGTENGTIGP